MEYLSNPLPQTTNIEIHDTLTLVRVTEEHAPALIEWLDTTLAEIREVYPLAYKRWEQGKP